MMSKVVPQSRRDRVRFVRLLGLGVAAVLLVGSLSFGMSAQTASAAISAGLQQTPVRIAPASAGGTQCLDVVGGPSGTVAGSMLQQYACQPRTQYNQVFKIIPQGTTGKYSISVQSSAGHLGAGGTLVTPQCLTLPSGSPANGATVSTQTCSFSSSATAQLWSIDASGTGWRISTANNRCLDVPGGSVASGVQLQVYDCSSVTQQRFSISAQPYPRVGVVYQSWFDLDTPAEGCAGTGWADGPFQTTPGSAAVKSLSFGSPTCYRSHDPAAAQTHAGLLNQMGASFVLIDDTNYSKTRTPANNPIYQASKQVTLGMNSASTPLKVAYALSLTCWQSQCYNSAGNNPAWDDKEMVVWNSAAAAAEIQDIAARYAAAPSNFEVVDGKPLLVFYLNQGNNVYCPRVPPASLQAAGLCLQPSYSTLTKAFNGPGNILPSASQFDPTITVNGQQRLLSEVFTVRYGVVASSVTDYADYDSRIWPWNCAAACVGDDAGYTSISVHGAQRNWAGAASLIESSLTSNGGDARYLVLNAWNEFSSTDEYSNHSYTVEPNTYSHTVAGDEAAGDPWYFFNKFKSTLAKWR